MAIFVFFMNQKSNLIIFIILESSEETILSYEPVIQQECKFF